ncbi:5,10-methylenetetrahydromethanopterin reductase [Halobacteriales archaeon QS_8_69_26]|nr:MAG: 5,10-methylenetetrahydromethanopterin reductase [Halobacteriales archaeon QS_8_69_26]
MTGRPAVDSIAPGIELTPEHPVGEVVPLAERAERAGFRSALVSCHYFNRDPYVVADSVGRATEMLVGPAAANPYDAHPVALASRVATLQETTGGRAVFGLAPGDRSTLAALGVEQERPLRRVLETTRVARRLWRGEAVDHDGTFAAADAELRFSVDPAPVYVGAQGPHMLRMAAKHADGVLVNASHPRDLAWASDRIDEGLAERPGDESGFESLAYASVSLAQDGEEAREAARPPVAFIAGGAADPVLDRHGIDRDAAERVSELVERGDLREAFAAVTPSMLDAFAVAGDPETVTQRLRELHEHVDGVVFGAPLGPDPDEAVSLAGSVLSRL